MRHPDASRGPTPTTCHQCRIGNPDLGWCDFHERPHQRSMFYLRPERAIGIDNACRDAVAYKAARARDKPQRACPSCQETRESWYFRGGRHKSPVCRVCEAGNAGARWCVECSGWLPESSFNRTGVEGRYWTIRCKTCRWGWEHGITRTRLDELLGDDPKCAACGSRSDLKIDHDHHHCPASKGCDGCVRAVLCHQCNTAEGLLRTPERARQLATYMERWSRSAAM